MADSKMPAIFSMADSPAEKKTYKGNCHCGNVRFTVSMPALETLKPVRCSCSVCVKNGYLLVYPKIEDVVFTHGSMATMSEYRTASKSRPHKFCGICGTSVMIELKDGNTNHLRENVAVNIRTLEDVDEVLDKLEFTEIDGNSFGGNLPRTSLFLFRRCEKRAFTTWLPFSPFLSSASHRILTPTRVAVTDSQRAHSPSRPASRTRPSTRRNPQLQAKHCPDYDSLVARRRLGRTNLAVAPAKIGSSNATMPSNLGPFEYAHLRAPLPSDLKGSEIFSQKHQHMDSYFLMRRSRDGHISASGMFKIAFPWAKHSEELDERDYLRTRPETSEDEIAGNVWISPELALELAKEYDMLVWVRALLDPTDISDPADNAQTADAENAIPEPPKFDLPPLDGPLLAPPEPETRGRARRSASPSKSASGRKMAIPRKSRRAQKESNANAGTSLQTSLDAAAASPIPEKPEEEEETRELNGHNDDESEEHAVMVKRPKERVTVEVESKVDNEDDVETTTTNVSVKMPVGLADLPLPENTEKMLETAKEMVEEATKLQAEQNEEGEEGEEEEEQAEAPPSTKKVASKKRKAEELVVEGEEEAAEDPHAMKRARVLEDKLRRERVRNRALFGVTATLAMAAAIPYFF
ncbi:uncharacterized protein GIQ15_02452 [Arthroderma uncinatum]|uniref:uncharacterized protein n=1 Tax=Arthroderma uncinatum TaxID=74035 RepID=UPI00144ACA14|nr:uncharacterized protein GIQ15_02452 [Arthroderma uncinatum]KAF3483128.1 hypothetical protein GIQ15_02452 [Arthroderma uncinatum]